MPDDPPRTRTVTLEVDPTSDPIHGLARDELGVERPFHGWVGLATALEQALDLHPALDRRGGTKVRSQ
jgi:hypothetical protein